MSIQLVVIGAGGHAKMAIEAAKSGRGYHPVACLAPHASTGSTLLGLPVYTETRDQLAHFRDQACAAFVAIGDNALRFKLTSSLKKMGFRLPSIVARHAWLSPSADIGEGCLIMHSAVVGADAVLGPGCIVNNGATVDHDCRIGSYVHVAPGCHLAGHVEVGQTSFLGVGTSVIPEKKIGDRVTVGAGSVVVSDLPDDGVYVGCPAQRMNRGRVAA
jgi:UDP-perosamine 4-acetyltransferase